jgi:hypothetical protein
MSRDYGWKRFWRSREGTYSLADSGFLVDPEGKYGKLTHPNLMAFARLEGIPGLAEHFYTDKANIGAGHRVVTTKGGQLERSNS